MRFGGYVKKNSQTYSSLTRVNNFILVFIFSHYLYASLDVSMLASNLTQSHIYILCDNPSQCHFVSKYRILFTFNSNLLFVFLT